MPVLFDIMKFQRLYRRTLTRTGDVGATVYIKLGQVGPGKIRVLTHVTVENRTDTTTQIRIGIDHGGILHYVDELKTVVATELVVSRSHILLGEGDRFFSELIGTHDIDELVMTCLGWEQKL